MMRSGTMASTEVLYHRAVQATTQREADAAFVVCVRTCERLGRSTADATRIVRDTLGYFAAAYCEVKLAEPLVRPGLATVSVISPGLPACVCTTARPKPIQAGRAHTPP